MAEVDLVIGNAEKMRPGDLGAPRPGFHRGDRKVQVDDIMSVTETAGHLIDGFGTPVPRLCAGPERLRSPLHLLHHSLWPRGNSRSVPAGVVVDQIKRLVDRGLSTRSC
jgi:threonylcarbamoyladenosine tRNA methylthiotransferase MtaB